MTTTYTYRDGLARTITNHPDGSTSSEWNRDPDGWRERLLVWFEERCEPDKPPRCTHTYGPRDRDRCIHPAGHAGLCTLDVSVTDARTGRKIPRFQNYYGINYQRGA